MRRPPEPKISADAHRDGRQVPPCLPKRVEIRQGLRGMLVTVVATKITRIPLRVSLVVGISLAQIGEFSFLLAYTGQKLGAISPFLYELIVATAVISMLMTPVMVTQAPRLAHWLVNLPVIRNFVRSQQEELAESESESLDKHVIVCGFGPLGETFGNILKEYKISYIILELNRLARK